jgi:hypothetical protein
LTHLPVRSIIATMAFRKIIRLVGYLLLVLLILGGSSIPPGDKIERVRAFTRNIEFDYITWTLDAVGVKLTQSALNTSDYITQPSTKQNVLDYINLIDSIQREEAELYTLYANPNIANADSQAIPLQKNLDTLYTQRAQLGPLAESIIQKQLASIIAEQGLAIEGQAIPPILYHTTPLPTALIVSPRDVIRQDADISLVPDLTLDQKIVLENKVDKALNVSSLVEGIGGVGVYPTMVMQTTDMNWVSEVVAHEWVHNFLSLRPLGISYLNSPDLRTMNETVASIAGKELGRAMMEEFYPELVPPTAPETPPADLKTEQPATPPEFDFRSEMHLTRITVDQLLAEKEISEAEAYMDKRRIVFWEHGYQIRKLNQAYFAFHGAYADQPGGAAGKDPVGAAVRLLRGQSPSLAAFINRMSWMWSFQQLQQVVGNGN